MDFISHGLWGGIAFGRKSERFFLFAFLFGIMPDVLSFGILTFMRIFGIAGGPDWSKGHPEMWQIPKIVHDMYNVTHSLFVFAFVFAVVLIVTRKIFWPMFAWFLHILMDIPTHSLRFFPTPFLWPFSDYKFDGVGWGHPYIFYPNIVILLIIYSIFLYSRRRKRDNDQVRT